MSHFSPADWVDFTRRRLPPLETQEMQSHLDRRCEECLNSAALWCVDQRIKFEDEEFANVAEATSKTRAAYYKARTLLTETGDERLLAELDAMAIALDQLVALATIRRKPSPSG